MNKKERVEYLGQLDNLLPLLSNEDMSKFDFAKQYVNDLFIQNNTPRPEIIQVGPVDTKIFEYFIYTILVKYESFITKIQEWPPWRKDIQNTADAIIWRTFEPLFQADSFCTRIPWHIRHTVRIQLHSYVSGWNEQSHEG